MVHLYSSNPILSAMDNIRAVGRHTLPAIHCLMTSKSQYLYRSILEYLTIEGPDFHPSASMSDWNQLQEMHLNKYTRHKTLWMLVPLHPANMTENTEVGSN